MKKFISKLIPNPLKRRIRNSVDNLKEAYYEKEQENLHQKALRRVKNKEKINVVFFAILPSVWKYDSVFKLMQKDSLFNPIILVCPQVNRGKEFMFSELKRCYEYFKNKGYNTICSYDYNSKKLIDARDLSPDIIFYTNPYKGLIDDKYYITNFRDILTCYVNYGFLSVDKNWTTSLPLHKLVWKFFCEYDHTRHLKAVGTKLKYHNRIVTGYPIFDCFINPNYDCNDWKIENPEIKKIIWAPHHSIDPNRLINFSTFLKYYDLMLKLRDKYKNQIQIAFKPHPLLRSKLEEFSDWTKERINEYYANWANGENSSLVEGDYINLFKSSDAMIHDCGSFTIEYLYTQKPVMYTNDESHASELNPEAQMAFNSHYLVHQPQDIEDFILNVVIAGNDTMKEKRKLVYNSLLLPPNNKSVAENIIEHIKSNLK